MSTPCKTSFTTLATIKNQLLYILTPLHITKSKKTHNQPKSTVLLSRTKTNHLLYLLNLRLYSYILKLYNHKTHFIY